jgi:uncharacterized pyridoxamine 5'-phosphate oxidase family protein
MNRTELVEFMRRQPWAVQASVAESGAPQAAVIGVVITDEAEVFFDTLGTSRKARNLRRDPRIALVLGWDDGRTVQYEGVADEPAGAELARLKELYFARFADGRDREKWPHIAYFRARPAFVRYSDFSGAAPVIVEMRKDELA